MKGILRSLRFSALPIAGVTLVACGPFFADEMGRPAPTQGPHVVQADLRQSIGYYDNAVTAINNRHYGLALEYLQAARSQKPDDVRVLTAFGVVYDKLGRFDLSARYYAQAASLDPKSRIVAADMDYSRKLQGILTPNAPMAADAGPSVAGGTLAQAATDRSKAPAAPNASTPQALTSQVAVKDKDPIVPAKDVTPTAINPIPVNRSSVIANASVAGSKSAPGTAQLMASGKAAAPVAAAAHAANDARKQAVVDPVAANGKSPVPPDTKPTPITNYPSAAIATSIASSNNAAGTALPIAPASSKRAVPVSAAAQNASAVHEQAAISQAASNEKAAVAKTVTLAAAQPVNATSHTAVADIPNAGSNIASTNPVPAKKVPPALAKPTTVPNHPSLASTNIAGGTTPRTVANSIKVGVPVAAAVIQNVNGAHKEVAVSQVAVQSKDSTPAKVTTSAAKPFFLTGRPLAIVDASGRKDMDKSVRAYRSGRGWSIAKGEGAKAQARPQTMIFYKETMVTAARALARTLSLPLSMHLTSRNDVEGLQLILGSDVSGQIIAGKLLQAQHRQLALAIAKPKS